MNDVPPGQTAALSQDLLMEAYMNHWLEQGEPPRSMAQFAKTLARSESDLYAFFSSLPALETQIFKAFFSHSLDLLHKSPEYADYTASEKLLAVYYTFFELLSANRSYVLLALPADHRALQQWPRLSGLHRDFVAHLQTLLPEFPTPLPPWPGRDRLLAEAFWLQCLSLLVFWCHDSSPHFEQTDIFIEKSVAASLANLQLQPGPALWDWGKFCGKALLEQLKP